MQRCKTNKQAFTLLEVLISIFLMSMLIIGLISLERLLSSSRRILQTNSQAYNEASISLQAMITEIRNARPASNGSYPLALADDNQIIFYANVDDDPEPERVRYYVIGTELNRGIIQPTGTPFTYNPTNEQVNLVIPYVDTSNNPLFTYYNGDWPADTTNNPLPAPTRLTETKMVTVKITINPDPIQHPESAYYLTSSAQIRNLKTNL